MLTVTTTNKDDSDEDDKDKDDKEADCAGNNMLLEDISERIVTG